MTKLLIIEHSKSVRNNLCERLEFEGYTTQSAECAEQVAATIEQGDIDLIITDDAATLPQTETPERLWKYITAAENRTGLRYQYIHRYPGNHWYIIRLTAHRSRLQYPAEAQSEARPMPSELHLRRGTYRQTDKS